MFDAMTNPADGRPKNFGSMRDANGHAKLTGPCGDTVEVWLRIDGGKVRKGSFITDGCANSAHCCSTAVKLVEGMSPEEAAELTQAQVLDKTGPVPEDHRHCALLAANVIKLAMADFNQHPAKQPFLKRIFRK